MKDIVKNISEYNSKKACNDSGYILASVLITCTVLIMSLSIVLQYVSSLSVSTRQKGDLISASSLANAGISATFECLNKEPQNFTDSKTLTAKDKCVENSSINKNLLNNGGTYGTFEANTNINYSGNNLTISSQGLLNKGSIQTATFTKANVPIKKLRIPVVKTNPISVGYEFNCITNTERNIYCWGYNGNGQLGIGNTHNSNKPKPIDTSGILASKKINTVSAGGDGACAVDNNGKVYCWGDNGYGQLGNNSLEYNIKPVKVYDQGYLKNKTIVDISRGDHHVCALDSDGVVYCWGDNRYGQLGDGTETNRSVPIPVKFDGDLSNVKISSISAESRHTCAVSTQGHAYCWGNNSYGQLGDGTKNNSNSPVKVSDKRGPLKDKIIKQISAGVYHTCALDTQGKAYCWGNNSYGQLGDGTKGTYSNSTPKNVYDEGYLRNKYIIEISSGEQATCAISMEGKAYCWGNNSHGQLGVGDYSDRTKPSEVLTNNTIIIDIGTKRDGTCAVDFKGKAYCWGSNSDGQLGLNGDASRSRPTAINQNDIKVDTIEAMNNNSLDDNSNYISASGTNSCIINTDYNLYCWGSNRSGQTGSGTKEYVGIPRKPKTDGVLAKKIL